MNKKFILIISILMLLSQVTIIFALPETGYISIIDELNNNDMIQYANDVTYNSTYTRYNLKWVTGTLTPYDLSTFTEVDEGNVNTYTSSNSSFTNYLRYQSLHLYKDLGVGSITDYTYYIDVYCNTQNPNSEYIFLPVVSNNIGDYEEISNEQCGYLRQNNYLVYIGLSDKGGNSTTLSYGIQNQRWYYLIFSRIGSTLTLKIYSDSARTTLLKTLTLTNCQTTAWRYLYALQGYDYSTASYPITGKIGNLRYTTVGYKTTGYLYTKNIMENITNNCYIFRCETDLNGQSMTISFSHDNSTWFKHDNTTGSESIIGDGLFYLKDLNYTSPLYLKITFSTTANTLSPYLTGYELITTDEPEPEIIYIHDYSVIITQTITSLTDSITNIITVPSTVTYNYNAILLFVFTIGLFIFIVFFMITRKT